MDATSSLGHCSFLCPRGVVLMHKPIAQCGNEAVFPSVIFAPGTFLSAVATVTRSQPPAYCPGRGASLFGKSALRTDESFVCHSRPRLSSAIR